jgi:hypothetical protein
MMTKTSIALAAALLLGVASAAQAGPDRGPEFQGGYHIGPLGQWFGGPAFRRGYYSYGYAPYGAFTYAPRHYRMHRYYWGY